MHNAPWHFWPCAASHNNAQVLPLTFGRKCNIDFVLTTLPTIVKLRKLVDSGNLLDKCPLGVDVISQQITQIHYNTAETRTQHATAHKRQENFNNNNNNLTPTMNRRLNATATATATGTATPTMPTTAALTTAFAPIASFWQTAATAITRVTWPSETNDTDSGWLQDEGHHMSSMLADKNVNNNNNREPAASNGNFSYFAPAISHVILAPTIASTTTTSTLMTSLPVVPVMLQPGVMMQNASASEIAAGGVSVVSGAAGSGTDAGSSTNGDNLNSFYFYETEQFAVLWILFTVIVLGNSAVLFVMFINKNRKSRMNYFIKQLAIADLSVGLLHVLTDIVWRMTISWRAGNVACKVIRFSQVCVTYSSTYVLVAMSIDRYDAITHPMNFSKSWKRARHLVAAAWIISALFSLPILVLYEEKLIQGQMQCWIELGSPWAWQVYMCLVSASLFAFPALIISACYAIIVKTIWAKGSIFVPAERSGYGNPATRRASSRGIIPRAKVKTVKMTFVIVIVFIVCWSPYIIFDLLQVFGQIPQTQTNIAIATFIQSLAPLNSAANPLIYCLFSSQVFRTLSRFPPFKWFSCCCRSYRHNSSQNRCHTVGRRLHHSCDSMRTLTTSLTVSRRSNKAAARVVICERPKNALAMSEV